jgi:dihydroxyacetone kinase-like protein
MAMKKFLNSPENLVNELIEGMALAQGDKVRVVGENLVVRAVPKPEGKVALVTLGGSGHEPALSGFVGEGMLDISVPGEIFSAPGPPRVIEALRMANRAAGVLFIVLNHEGDVLSADMVMEMAEEEGLNVKMVLTHEDISGGSREDPSERRGMGGCMAVIKAAGAAAEMGKSLDECVAIAERMERNLGTLAVAVAGATHPATGEVIASVDEGEMVVGMGQHGEAGGGTQKLKSANETVAIMADALIDDLKLVRGEKALAIINGVGATTLMEQYVLLGVLKKHLASKGIEAVRFAAGEFLTVQEMGGFQMILGRLDDELLSLWDAPCHCPALSLK